MKQKTLEILDALDRDLEAFATTLEQYDEASLNHKPRKDVWSALQCMHHLILSEGGSQRYVEKKLSFNPELPDRGLADFFRGLLIVNYLRLPLKAKAPKGIDDEFLPVHSTLAETLHLWRNQRKSLRDYLSNLDDKLYTKQVYKHPFAGRVSLEAMIAFFRAHFARHRKQALRTLGQQ